MAETPASRAKAEEETTPAAEAPTTEKVILTTEFTTNGQVFGGIEGEDEDGNPLLYEVEVPSEMAADLRRRQREYDRSQRERFQNRNFRVMNNGGMRAE